MAKSRVRDEDLGYEKMRRNMKDLSEISVLVGIQDGSSAPNGQATIAEYGVYNEMGTKRIPSRPFMRKSFDEKVEILRQAIAKLIPAVQDGRVPPEQAGGLIGELHQGHIQDTIRSNMAPANSPATVARKGSSRTLQDQGNLVQAIRWVIERGRRGSAD